MSTPRRSARLAQKTKVTYYQETHSSPSKNSPMAPIPSGPRRSARLAQKPKVTYSEQPRSLLIQQAFATPVSDRTDDQHLLVDDVLQNLAKARYMKDLYEFYYYNDHHSLCSCYDCWEFGDYYYEDDYDAELDPDHEPLEKVLAFEQSDIMKRMIAAGNPPMFMMSSYK
jgi:hypothetical protein